VKPQARFVVLAVWVAWSAIQAGATDAQVSYVISLAGASQHLVHVKLLLAPGNAERELQLPVWNGLYQIRDFAQYVNWVRARDGTGQPVPVEKTDKGRWRVSGAGAGAEIEYEIFADRSGPFGAQLNLHHAFFNLAEILMYPVDARGSPMHIRFVDIPSDWKIATPLAEAGEGFSSENYDRLVDSPVEIGGFREADFDEGGGHYRVVVDADAATYDLRAMVSILRRLAAAATGWMKDRPYQTYLFIYHFPGGASAPGSGGGMEHAYATAIDINAERLAANSLSLADLTSHEFFHLWNVKRIRPQSLEPVDYTQENYTRALWFSEGVTTTAGNIIGMRAGLLDEARNLRGLAAEIAELEREPAHLTQSAEESSLDAWLEKYAYYRLPTRSISYYNKGYLLGMALDLQLRAASRDKASLRDVFLAMNQNARKGLYFADSEGVKRAAELVSHSDLGWFFEKYVSGTEDIPWDKLLSPVGLHLLRRTVAVADAGFVAVRNFDGAPSVASVAAGSEAERAGLAVGDDILTINGYAAGPDFEQRLGDVRPEEVLHLRVRQRGGHGTQIERELSWKPAQREQIEFELKDVDIVTPEQRSRRTAWLFGESGLCAGGCR
jgi:predicted metalloprotease with PDZ domain